MALTNNWSKQIEFQVTLPTGYKTTVKIDAKLNSQSVANNTSSVSVRARFTFGYPWYANSPVKIRYGKNSTSGNYGEFSHTYTSSSKAPTTEQTSSTWTGTITHNEDGTATLPLYGYIYQKEWIVSKSSTGSVALPTIPRASQPTITPNPFNIGDTITINPNRKVNTYTDNIQMVVGSGSVILAQDETEPFTFDTSTIENDFYALMSSTSSYSNNVENQTYDGATLIGSNTTNYTALITNANPTFTVGYKDTNATTVAITGNNQKIIRNKSTLQINITNASALKGATLSTADVVLNGNTYSGTFSGNSLNINVGTVDLASNDTASIIVTDSRGSTTTQTVEIQVYNWELPSAIITCGRRNNYYSETDITVDADYSSLGGNNTITIQCRYKKTTSGTWGAYQTLTDNTLSTLQLDNTYSWDIQVLLTDLLGSTTYNLSVDKGIPIAFFDRLKRSVSVDCFPQHTGSLEVGGVDLVQDKQDTLISGTNIKTINNTSLLGSGNITIGGGGIATDVQINGTSITSSNTADIKVDGTYNASTNKIATMSSLPSAGTSATAVDTTASGGSASTYSKSDHKHSISSGTITSALGYTPYSSANPNGYTSNTGTITSVKMNGSTVASSGEADLGTVITSHQNIKTINNESLVGTGNINLVTSSDLSGYVLSSSLSTVATSGSYNDLIDKPTIPSVGNTKIYYGTSSTSAGTQTKTVTCSGFTLETGATIFVKFTYGQTYNGVPKLNVNSTGAINVRYKGDTNGIRYMWSATEVMGFTYDGTYWVAIGRALATTTYYGVTKLTDSASSTSTTTSLTPASLNRAMQYTVTGYPVYSSSSTYAVGDKCRYGNYAYECNTAITTAESWTSAHWTALPDLQTQINGKQDTLVSGTSIKTINNESILGSGNINIGGGGGSTTDVQINGTSITSSGTANIITEGTYNASTNKLATMSDVPNEDLQRLAGTTINLNSLTTGNYTCDEVEHITYYDENGVQQTLDITSGFTIIKVTQGDIYVPFMDDTAPGFEYEIINSNSKYYKGMQMYIETLGFTLGNLNEIATTDDIPTTSSIVDLIYPVGSIYMSVNSTSPQTLFGGTWQQIQDTFLLASGSTYTAGATGGSATHTLTTTELPAHTHGSKSLTGTFQIRRAGSGGGTDVIAAQTGTVTRTANGGDTVASAMSVTSASHKRDLITIDNTHEHDSVGGDTAFSILPPYLVVYMWKRTA